MPLVLGAIILRSAFRDEEPRLAAFDLCRGRACPARAMPRIAIRIVGALLVYPESRTKGRAVPALAGEDPTSI